MKKFLMFIAFCFVCFFIYKGNVHADSFSSYAITLNNNDMSSLKNHIDLYKDKTNTFIFQSTIKDGSVGTNYRLRAEICANPNAEFTGVAWTRTSTKKIDFAKMNQSCTFTTGFVGNAWYIDMYVVPTSSLSSGAVSIVDFTFKLSTEISSVQVMSFTVENIDSLSSQQLEEQKKTNEKLDKTNKELEDLNKNQKETNETLKDSDTSEASDSANSFFEGFDSDDFGLTDIITMPLEFIEGLSSGTCNSLKLPVPFVNQTIELPCMTDIYKKYFGAFLTLYQTITTGFISYWVCINIFKLVQGFKNPDKDEIEVLDL